MPDVRAFAWGGPGLFGFGRFGRRVRRLLDIHTGAAGAWSMRRLSSSYGGPCIRLRRSSDNAESNFGFDASGWLDMAAVSAWLGAATAFVVTWFDQSGNGRDMSQATAARQPSLSASVASFNNRPAATFDAGQLHHLFRSNDVILSVPATAMAVAYREGTQSQHSVFSVGTNTAGTRFQIEGANTGMRAGAGTGAATAFSSSNTWPIPGARAFGGRVGGGNATVLVESVTTTLAAADPTISNIMAAIGRIANGTAYYNGSILEVVAWANDTVDWLTVHAEQRTLRV